MIQFNLLPDIKREYIKTQRTKRLMIGVSTIAGAAALFILLVLIFSVDVVQSKSISDLKNTVQNDSMTLKNTPNLTTILTLQSQLNSLASLDSQNPVATRLFGFLSQFTPTQATISDLQINFNGQSAQSTQSADSMTITGNAPNLAVVNTFVDNLRFSTYTVSGQSGSKNAFSSVILSGFSLNSITATYSITLNFDPTIFNNTDNVTLSVGNTQSQTAGQEPSIIFSKGN